MPTLKDNKANHQAFFAGLAKLAEDHGATIDGSVVTFMDGLVDPECKPGYEAETTARYLIHSVGSETVEVEALEYNRVQQSVDLANLCSHPWHSNPGLITPCPECDEGRDDDEESSESASNPQSWVERWSKVIRES